MALIEHNRLKQYADRITLAHQRLQSVSVVDAINEEAGIDSRLSPIPTHLLLVPPELLGVHEATIGDPADPAFVPEGHGHSGFSEIDFTIGWSGPAIAVAASSTEIYDLLRSKLETGNNLALFEGFDYGDLGVLDGHHRHLSAQHGPTKLSYVPVQLIPFPVDPSVKLGTWHSDGVCWTPEQVFECFKNPEMYADAKRTKFMMVGTDGNEYRILHLQPNVSIPLESLV